MIVSEIRALGFKVSVKDRVSEEEDCQSNSL